MPFKTNLDLTLDLDLSDPFAEDTLIPEFTLEEAQEDNPKIKEYLETKRKAAARSKDADDYSFYVCIVFQTEEQKKQFLADDRVKDVDKKYGLYLNGEDFADVFKIKISTNEQKPRVQRTEKNLSNLV